MEPITGTALQYQTDKRNSKVMSNLQKLIAALLVVVSSHTFAATDEEVILDKLQKARPDFQIDSINPSVVAGLYEVQITAGPILYVTANGDHFFLGDLFSVGVEGIVNLAERARDMDRKAMLATVDEKDMIIFPPIGEKKTSITVFTDVDCFYCQKLHKEVPAMNAMGIEVRYLAYPRSGIGGESYRKIASAWCADDRNAAITMLKNREDIPENVCAKNPVADQFMLGQQLGVRGTPALVLEDGQMLPGYVSADELAGRLGIN
jgi:thiol:disulfide interchange protein DsbC